MDLDRATVLADLARIAAALASRVDDDNAQGDAADLNAIAAWIEENTREEGA